MNEKPTNVSSPTNDSLWQRVEDSNLDPKTLLATDYLNHFNEIVMLLEMVPDMPDMLEDGKAWKPKSYKDHFRDSTIADRALAIEAYDHVPALYREPFEQTVAQINATIASAIRRIEADMEAGDLDILRENTLSLCRILQRLMETASAIIHGSAKTLDQAEINLLLGE